MTNDKHYGLNGICLVKNEEDIIAQSLQHAARFCDRIFVIDNGSTDSTWPIVQGLHRENAAIVPFCQIFKPFHHRMRSIVYNDIRSELNEDDWWLSLDADEFMDEDPQPVIRQAMAEQADLIRSWQVQFYFTEIDRRQWENGHDDRRRHVFDRRRHYLINWQEKRLFRNKKGLVWTKSNTPEGLGKACTRRIFNRHYAFRDPEQIQKRLQTRFGHPLYFRHVKSTDVTSVMRKSHTLNYLHDGSPRQWKFSGLYYYHRRRFMRRTRKKSARIWNWALDILSLRNSSL